MFGQALSSNFEEGKIGMIAIEDFDIATVEGFIQWLYLGRVEPDELADKLFVFGDKYQIGELKVSCFWSYWYSLLSIMRTPFLVPYVRKFLNLLLNYAYYLLLRTSQTVTTKYAISRLDCNYFIYRNSVPLL
jgi:hypothetical protein